MRGFVPLQVDVVAATCLAPIVTMWRWPHRELWRVDEAGGSASWPAFPKPDKGSHQLGLETAPL